MEENLNGRRPQWKTTSIEDNLNGRRPQCMTTTIEDNLNGIEELLTISIKQKYLQVEMSLAIALYCKGTWGGGGGGETFR